MKKVNYFRLANPEWNESDQFYMMVSGKISRNKKYKDPDANCKGLYEDMESVYFLEENKININLKIDSTKIFYNNTLYLNWESYGVYDYALSSDYIGASIYWAYNAGFTNNEIVKMLGTSRNLGGHILFPVRNGRTVNQARGGSKTYYDRFDLTLWAIQQWYENKEVNSKIRSTIERYAKWFDLFLDLNEKNGFANFIKFNKLEDWVVEKNGEYKIYDLVKSDLVGENEKYQFLDSDMFTGFEKDSKEIYMQYVNNVNKLIELRTEKLLK